jgi:hypothetical protein
MNEIFWEGMLLTVEIGLVFLPALVVVTFFRRVVA